MDKQSKQRKNRISNEAKIYKRLSTELKRQQKASMPESLTPLEDEVRIMLPAPFLTMEFENFENLRAIHIDILREMLYYIREVLIKQLDPDYQGYNSLFRASDFSKNGKDLDIVMMLKDFHVSPKHYPKLRAALHILPTIPVWMPFLDGDKRKYKRITHLCDVYLPDEDEKIRNYVHITMEEEVARSFITMKFGYGEVGRIAQQNLSSKYSKRIYGILSRYKDLGGYTMSISEFRRVTGTRMKYEEWKDAENNILLIAKQDIDKHFSQGECDLSFTYQLIYNDKSQKTGEPSAIKFTIYSATTDMDRKLIVVEKGYMEQLEKFLKDELKLSDSICNMLMKRVTRENVKAAISTAINIKLKLDSGNVRLSMNYIIGAFNKFFETFVPPTDDKITPQGKWQKIQESIGKGRSSDVTVLFSQLMFKEYSEEANEIILVAPSREFAEKELAGNMQLLLNKVSEYFNDHVNIRFEYKNVND